MRVDDALQLRDEILAASRFFFRGVEPLRHFEGVLIFLGIDECSDEYQNFVDLIGIFQKEFPDERLSFFGALQCHERAAISLAAFRTGVRLLGERLYDGERRRRIVVM